MSIAISVIMPSLNVAEYISQCIESIMQQTLLDIEIICVDAGSTDGTRKLLDEYARRDGRIVVLDSPVKSYGKQVNMGIQYANGEYISIVDTDDWIHKDMLKDLYGIAKDHDIECVNSNPFFVGENGETSIDYILKDELAMLYNKILSVEEYPFLHRLNRNAWGAIYRLDFLKQNHILFNETPGAAFQDVGFIHQMLCFAERIIYTNNAYYYYRVGREGSSSCSSNYLKYLCQEYEFIFHAPLVHVNSWALHKKFILERMADSFMCELDRHIREEGYIFQSPEWLPYYEWMKSFLLKELENQFILEEDFEPSFWFRLRLAIHSIKSYMDFLYIHQIVSADRLDQLIKRIDHKNCVIFGCGQRGKGLLRKLLSRRVGVNAFFDNNPSLFGSSYCGVPTVSPNEIHQYSSDTVYIIANQNEPSKIREQLLRLGIKEQSILEYLPI